jgi:RNA polymerase sigma-70 factor (ECF subfamily)
MSAETRERITAARNGDLAAFGMLVERYRKPLCAFVYTIVGDYHLSQDVAQDAFLSAHGRMRALRDSASFPSWLFRIAYRHAVDLVRERQRQHRLVDCAADGQFSGREIRDGDGSTLPPDPLQTEERRRIQAALDMLRSDWSGPLVLRYYEGLTCREIGRVLGIGEEAVRVRLHRGRRALRRKLRALGLAKEPDEGVEDEVRGRRASPRRPA